MTELCLSSWGALIYGMKCCSQELNFALSEADAAKECVVEFGVVCRHHLLDCRVSQKKYASCRETALIAVHGEVPEYEH